MMRSMMASTAGFLMPGGLFEPGRSAASEPKNVALFVAGRDRLPPDMRSTIVEIEIARRGSGTARAVDGAQIDTVTPSRSRLGL